MSNIARRVFIKSAAAAAAAFGGGMAHPLSGLLGTDAARAQGVPSAIAAWPGRLG